MNKLISFLLLLAVTGLGAERISMTVTVTNPPVTSDTFTVNGSTRTWTNLSSSSYILTNLVDINGSATNLFNNYAAFTLGGGIIIRWLETNQVQFVGPVGVALAGSLAGSWGTVSLSTQSGPQTYTALWPMENMVGPTNRTNQGSSFVSGLSAYSTNAFATNSTALSNFITKGASPVQHITSELRIAGNINNGTSVLSVSNLVNYGNSIRSEGSGGNSLQIGSNALANGSTSIAIGNSAIASNTTTMAIGTGAIATNDYSMAIGNGAIAGEGTDALAVGRSATAYGPSTQAIGQGSIADGNASLAIQSEVTGTNSVGIGASSSVSANSAVALGYSSSVVHHNSTAIGYSATTTTTNQVRLGTSDETVSIPGVLAAASITNATLRGTNIINGRVDFTAVANSSLANGNNAGVNLGTNVYVQLSGPTAAYVINGIAAGQNGTFHIVEADNPGLSITIANASGTDPTAENRIITGTGGDLVLTNSPAFFQVIYNSSASRWRVVTTSR